MVVLVTLAAGGMVGGGLGRAGRVALAALENGAVTSWEEIDVGWDRLHDSEPEGAHHARLVRFLRDRDVDAVVAGGMGEGMRRVLANMGIRFVLAGGGARQAALAAAVPG